MSCRRALRAAALACIAFACAGGDVGAATPVKVIKAWTGRVPLPVPPPLQSSIASAQALSQVWTLCQVKGPVPTVDFERQIVLLAARRSSTVRFADLVLANGNLRTSVVVAPDTPQHVTCALALVDRAGIARVNGAPLGQ